MWYLLYQHDVKTITMTLLLPKAERHRAWKVKHSDRDPEKVVWASKISILLKSINFQMSLGSHTFCEAGRPFQIYGLLTLGAAALSGWLTVTRTDSRREMGSLSFSPQRVEGWQTEKGESAKEPGSTACKGSTDWYGIYMRFGWLPVPFHFYSVLISQ